MVIYQFSNVGQIAFICFFAAIIIISIVIGLLCLPMLKLVFSSENSIKLNILLLFICIIIYVFVACGLILGVFNITKYGGYIRDTKLESCEIQKGEISKIITEPQLSRGADTVSYHIEFIVGETTFFINKDIGVPVQNIEHWKVGEQVTVYYRIEDNMNVAIRVEK